MLSYGGGQDSTAILLKIIHDPKFREKYVRGRLLVVMSDTGDEFPETMDHVELTKTLCKTHGIEFTHITPDMGHHTEMWTSLPHFYNVKTGIGSKAYPKTCTDKLKIGPIYKYLERWLADNYGVPCGRKEGIKEFARSHGKIRVIIGIAAGEEKRLSNAADHPAKWYRESIENCYPLVAEGMGRQECQDVIHDHGLRVIPSNCVMCPFLSLEELEYIRRFHPERLEEWIAIEARKLEKHKDLGDRNLGVWGKTPLPVKVGEARVKFSDWSDDRVREYRYSHGHCVMSKY